MGTLFLAITTSAPELVVAITALRMGAVDLAVADILGANMLNMATVMWIDLADGQGSVLAFVSSDHLIVASVAVLMSLLVLAGLRFRQRRKTLKVASWYVPFLIGLYVLGAYTLFKSGTGL